jgi:hypothetical protein
MGGFRRRRQFPFPGPILQEQPRGRKRGHQHFPVPSATAEMFRPHSPAGEGVVGRSSRSPPRISVSCA